MSKEIRLTLVRETQVLWVMRGGYDVKQYIDVTGVARLSDSYCFPVFVLHKGEPIDIVWDVVEIKEVW